MAAVHMFNMRMQGDFIYADMTMRRWLDDHGIIKCTTQGALTVRVDNHRRKRKMRIVR